MALVVKNLPVNAGDIMSLTPGWGRSPEGEMANHSSILAWRIHGQSYSPWGLKESDMTEQLTHTSL